MQTSVDPIFFQRNIKIFIYVENEHSVDEN